MDRRKFIANSIQASGGILLASCGLNEKDGASKKSFSLTSKLDFKEGRSLGQIDLLPQIPIPREKVLGEGLGGRRYTDLSRVEKGSLTIATHKFFIRTRAPKSLDVTNWKIRVDGDLGVPFDFSLEEILPYEDRQGQILMECAGNDLPGGFGLMSMAEWEGVRLADLFALVDSKTYVNPGTDHIRISGFDEHDVSQNDPVGSLPGAEWIFTRKQLEESGAFLATKINGEPLPRDNGFPLRLVVPGWYACVNIKWVNRISFLNKDSLATEHMKEYAFRIHQSPREKVADYAPALMEPSATPIRLEKWKIKNKVMYKLVGLLWGGANRDIPLEINFGNQNWEHVEIASPRVNARQWSLWEYYWSPQKPGLYPIRFRVANHITRRLDMDYYSRECRIDEV